MATTDRAQSPLSPLMLKLEQARPLDAAVRAAQPLMDAVSSRVGVRDALQGRWMGHALHPLLVMVPLGTWMSSLALDLSPTDGDGAGAQLLTGIGMASAVPSAITGWAELATADQRGKRVGVVHAGANVVGLALQGAAFVQRRRGNRSAATTLSAAAMGVAGAAGYLGGHLSVARDVGTRDVVFEAN